MTEHLHKGTAFFSQTFLVPNVLIKSHGLDLPMMTTVSEKSVSCSEPRFGATFGILILTELSTVVDCMSVYGLGL